ncbi:hypothetical protein HYALB_00008281 [Hymenoscyphus albidus]|uniref:Uncharacterized protein n=1 Tax=Hymenoscyphus albidus TaxID=595503 RepID=A0A9N9LG55_9HELO|nr:hypothetical protein HYALB_00008281 [Hymenoscyphus albidus]
MYVSGAERRQEATPTTPSEAGNSNTNSNGPTTDAAFTLSPTSTDLGSLSTASVQTAEPEPTKAHASDSSDSDSQAMTIAPVLIGILAAILALIFAYFLIRRARLKHKNPKYVPTPYLKNAWKKWDPQSSRTRRRLPDRNEHLESVLNNGSLRGGGPPSTFNSAARTAGGVDRNTSVRSVMTLPAYNPNPHHSEQVLGREGERGGIDTVVEFPETVDDEERLREEEMEALYQVRLARRRDNEEREERRRLRREARERGDHVALRELQESARTGSATSHNGRTVEELRAEHERIKNERAKAVSAVAYGDLGVARHDGTRLRANSIESEREGLLGDVASIAASSHYHRRERSASSVISLDTTNNEFASPGLPRPRSNSRPDSPFAQVRRPSRDGSIAHEGRAGSSPEMIEHDDIPPSSPPEYENIPLETTPSESPNEPPPDYTSPITASGEHRSMFEASDSHGSPTNAQERRTSTSSAQERRASSSSKPILSSPERSLQEERPGSSSRGVGGVPQLPSLRLAKLPSIQIDPSSPTVETIQEEATAPTSHPR